jgi:hypothetical protein
VDVAAEDAMSARSDLHLVSAEGAPADAPGGESSSQLFIVPHPKGVAIEMRFVLDGKRLSACAVLSPAVARLVAADIVAAADRMPFEVPHG